jgi:DNA-binding NarL/FixJ family response regulator
LQFPVFHSGKNGKLILSDKSVGERYLVNDAGAISVFVLAQNRLLRDALAKVLSRKNDVGVIGSCALSDHVLKDIVACSPSVLVMDSFTTNIAHIELVRSVQSAVKGIRLVVIDMEPDEQHFMRAVREGALGYVLKDASAVEVVTAIRAVANGEAVCPPQLCAFLFRYVARESQAPSFPARASLGLTNREQQIVWLISRGKTNKEIANELQLAEQTVRNHVHRILRKIGAPHRLAAVEMCRVQGLAV